MRVIVLASQKGGSGKTTLSGHLAVEAEKAGAGPVALIDTDPQGSLSEWWNSRAAETPRFARVGTLQLGDALEQLRNSGIKLAIIDTPPAITESISQVVAHADLVLVPTRPSPHDLRAVGATVDIAEQHGKPMLFVVNAATARARITGESAVALSQHGTVAPVTIHHRVDFAASMVDGRTVGEAAPGSASAREIHNLWTYVHDRLARLTKERAAAPPARPAMFAVSALTPVAADDVVDEPIERAAVIEPDERAEPIATAPVATQEAAEALMPASLEGPIASALIALQIARRAEQAGEVQAPPGPDSMSPVSPTINTVDDPENDDHAVVAEAVDEAARTLSYDNVVPLVASLEHRAHSYDFGSVSPTEKSEHDFTADPRVAESSFDNLEDVEADFEAETDGNQPDPLASIRQAIRKYGERVRQVTSMSAEQRPEPVATDVVPSPTFKAVSTWEPKALPPIRKSIQSGLEVESRNDAAAESDRRDGVDRRKAPAQAFGADRRVNQPFGRRSSDRVPFGKLGGKT